MQNSTHSFCLEILIKALFRYPISLTKTVIIVFLQGQYKLCNVVLCCYSISGSLIETRKIIVDLKTSIPYQENKSVKVEQEDLQIKCETKAEVIRYFAIW